MAKRIYLVRHCESIGQSAESPLTEKGYLQAKELSNFFFDIKIDRIISSPYQRAIQSVDSISKDKNIKIEVDDRLKERVLSILDLPDWLDKLKQTFNDSNLKFEGGESSYEAMNRINNVVLDVLKGEFNNIILVTHGNLLSLLLQNYIYQFDFDCWMKLSNPDVFLIKFSESDMIIEHAWKKK